MTTPRTKAKDHLDWTEIVETGVLRYKRDNPQKFHRRVMQGIPPAFRWQVWKAAVHQHCPAALLDRYRQLVLVHNSWTPQIEIDVGRTFPLVFDKAKELCLRNVLNAYASHNPDVGYCQGMTYVAALLLEVSNDEAESFVTFVRLMDRPDGLSGLYRDKLPLLQRYVRACEQMMTEQVPDLRDHFIREDVQPATYLTEWFLTLFINCFPLSMVKIIWDTILFDGLPVILKIAVSILFVLKDYLLTKSCEEIITFFKLMRTCDESDTRDGPDVSKIGQLLIKHAGTVNIPEHILRYISEGDDTNPDPDAVFVWGASRPATWLDSITRIFTFGMVDQSSARQ